MDEVFEKLFLLQGGTESSRSNPIIQSVLKKLAGGDGCLPGMYALIAHLLGMIS
jgi:hypothetical protein